MRICILNITSGDMCWGYRNYLKSLVPRLAAHSEVEALLVGLPQTVGVADWGGRIPSAQWLTLNCTLLARGREVGRKARREIEKFSPDVIFIPTARYWRLDGVPVVTMVRNMMPATRSCIEHLLDRAKNRARLAQMRHSVRRSSRVIAVSDFVRSYLENDLCVSADRVGVVYHGTECLSGEFARQPAGLPDCRRSGFLFAAGSIYPYRGIEDIVSAWDLLKKRGRCPSIVVAGFVGRGMQRYYEGLRALVRERDLDQHVHFLGTLKQQEMAWCYRHCSAFIMTSRVEACPNIALEAMAYGCLCISNQNPPLPEIFGDSAQFYPAGDSAALAECVTDVLALSDERRSAMKARTVAMASRYSWDECCDGTVAELKKAIDVGC